jgi:hypothetical protein
MKRRGTFELVVLLFVCSLLVPRAGAAQVEDRIPPVRGAQLERALEGADHTILVRGLGQRARYEIEVEGRVVPLNAEVDGHVAGLNPGDTIEGGLARGFVRNGNDAYEVHGEIRRIALESPGAALVLVDGERYEPASLSRPVALEMAPPVTAAPVAAQSVDTAPWRFVGDGVASITDRAGWGPTDQERRLDLETELLRGVAMAEQGDRPCALVLEPTAAVLERARSMREQVEGVVEVEETADGSPVIRRADDPEPGLWIDCLRGPLAVPKVVGNVVEAYSRLLTGMDLSSRRTAALEPGYGVVGLEVCVNGERRNARVKGVEVRGWKPEEYLDTELDRSNFMIRDGFERPNCRVRQFVSCPRQQMATGLVVSLRRRGPNTHWVNGLRLICRRVETP